MAHRATLLEWAIKGLKAQAREIENEIDLLEKELAETGRQAGRGIVRFAKAAAKEYGEAVAPAAAPKRKKRRISAAQRKAHSEAMKLYWQNRKAKQKR